MSRISAKSQNSISVSKEQDSLFTSLPSEAAAAISGGVGPSFNARFDFSYPSSTFSARPGDSISLLSSTQSTPSNRVFTATLFNVDTKRKSSETVSVGGGFALWSKVRGGRYRIILTDTKDNQFVKGSFSIATFT